MQDNVSYKFCPLMAAKKQVLHSLEVMSDAIWEEKALTQLSKNARVYFLKEQHVRRFLCSARWF